MALLSTACVMLGFVNMGIGLVRIALDPKEGYLVGMSGIVSGLGVIIVGLATRMPVQ